LPTARGAFFTSEHGPVSLLTPRAVASKAPGRLFRSAGQGRERQGGGKLGSHELTAVVSTRRQGHNGYPREAEQLGALLDLVKDSTNLGKECQGFVRDRLERGGGPARHRRPARHEAGHRTGRIEKVVDEIIAKNPDKVLT